MSEEAIITLTDAASMHIAKIIERHKKGIGFRLSVKETGCSGYMYAPEVVEEEREDDIRIKTEQGVVVFIDYRWLHVLQGAVIDLVDEILGQKRLVFKNPNVDDECGCGESFSLRVENSEH